MTSNSTFRCIGIVYQDPKFVKVNGRITATCIIVSNDNKVKKKYIPITAYGENAELLLRAARNGNLVVITGQINTNEYFDKTSGSSQIRVSFVMEDIMVLLKMTPTRLTSKRIEDLIGLFNLE